MVIDLGGYLGCIRTSRDFVHFVLYEEISQWDQGTKEQACKQFPVVHGLWIVWA